MHTKGQPPHHSLRRTPASRRMLVVNIILGVLFVSLLAVYALHAPDQKESVFPPSFGDAYLWCITSNDNDGERGRCLQRLSEHAITRHAISEIEHDLRGVDAYAYQRWCHEFMHYAGWALYKQKGSLSEAFAIASNECDAGMQHGVVEEYISQKAMNADPETFVRTVIPTACTEGIANEKMRVGAEGFCFHGLGHAFMFITHSDLNEALRYCDYLHDQANAESCYTGVFMENIDSKTVGRFGNHVSTHPYNPIEPDYPCNILDERYKNYCYVYKGIYNVNLYQDRGELQKAFEDCARVEEPYRKKCWWGTGNNLPAPGVGGDIVGEKCKTALPVGAEAYTECIWGAMNFLSQLNWQNPQEVVNFCGAAEPSHKEMCYRAAGKSLRSWSATESDFMEKCRYFTDESARRLCENFDREPERIYP